MTLEADLRDAIGERHVVIDPAVKASYETDWTRRFTGRPPCVARPGRHVGGHVVTWAPLTAA